MNDHEVNAATPPDRKARKETGRRRISNAQRELMSIALREYDPAIADELEARVVAQLINPELIQTDHVVAAVRNPRYVRLTPLRATALFAEIYDELSLYETTDPNPASSGLEHGIEEASLADIRHIWCARQQADALGMQYQDYISAVFDAHRQKGVNALPQLSDFHGQWALAVAVSHKLQAAECWEG